MLPVRHGPSWTWNIGIRFVFWQQRQHSSRKEINVRSNRNSTTLVMDIASAPFLWGASVSGNCSTPANATRILHLLLKIFQLLRKEWKKKLQVNLKMVPLPSKLATNILRRIEFEKCMSQQCHNTITGLFMSQCVILTACREWFNTHLTTIDQPGL